MNASIEVVSLGEAVKPTRPRVKPSDYPELPSIGMEHIEAHSMKLLGTVPAKTMKSSAVHFKAGDVLYGRLRPYLNKVYRPSFEGLCSAEFIVLPENDRLDGAYLQYFLNSGAFVRYATHQNAGDRPRVDFDQLAAYKIPLPGIDDQRRVVAEIEKQFSRLDEALANVRSAMARLSAYRASVLSGVQTGAICEMNHGDWPARTIEELATKVQYGSSAKTSAIGKGIPVLRMGNIENGELVLEDLKYLPINHAEFPELLLKPGDLLFNRTNSPELVGKVAVYRGNPSPCSFASYLIRLRFTDEVVPDFVAYVLSSPFGRAWVRSVVSQQVGQANVNGTKLKTFQIRVPPVQAQRDLVAEGERHLSLIRIMEAQFVAAELRSDRLRNRLLARAFTGGVEGPM